MCLNKFYQIICIFALFTHYSKIFACGILGCRYVHGEHNEKKNNISLFSPTSSSLCFYFIAILPKIVAFTAFWETLLASEGFFMVCVGIFA